MKRIVRSLTILIAFGIMQPCMAQEGFIFRNYSPDALDAPVFDAFGNRLAGTNYVAVFFGGPTEDALSLATGFSGVTPMPPITFTFRPNGMDGYFSGGLVIITNACGPTWLQVRAWDARVGSSYEQVVNLGLGGYGESSLFQLRGSDFCLPNPAPSPPLLGMQFFSLLPVIPEPSPLWLLLLGLPLLALRRRPWKRM
jgi:hypothetical protein